MSSPIMSHALLHITALVHFLLLLTGCASPSPPLQGAIEVDKIRLGSMPPSCHNRCNACNPCTAAQVPAVPGPTSRLSRPGPIGQANLRPDDQPGYTLHYSNYKPLGWKCRCGDRFFNP